jgi:hypothetical protein
MAPDASPTLVFSRALIGSYPKVTPKASRVNI